jgi:hypothetical protein
MTFNTAERVWGRLPISDILFTMSWAVGAAKFIPSVKVLDPNIIGHFSAGISPKMTRIN